MASCYAESVSLAAERGLEPLACPVLSCGVYGCPLKEAAFVALRAVSLAIEENEKERRFRFVWFHEEAHAAFKRALTALTTYR